MIKPRTNRLTIRLTNEERNRLTVKAVIKGQKTSDYARDVLNAETAKPTRRRR